MNDQEMSVLAIDLWLCAFLVAFWIALAEIATHVLL